MNKHAVQIACVYMSVVIGGGFASGQEVLQFFTGYGLTGIIGTLVSGLMFSFLGMQITRMSSKMQANSHKQILNGLFGCHIGLIMDVVLSFFLYGVGVVMLAGSSSIFSQHYNMPPLLGGGVMAILVMVTLCMNINNIIKLISIAMPFMLAIVLMIAIYSVFSFNLSIRDTEAIVRENYKTVTNNWFVSAMLYASFNIAVGFPMLAVIGGAIKQPRTAAIGGILGGLGLGVLILLMNIALLANIDRLQGSAVPFLTLAERISPLLSVVMSLVLICMIYSTAVGMFFAFCARFARPETYRFKLISVVSVCVGLGLSLGGFSRLVGTVYPLLGYIGFTLILAIAFDWVREQRLRLKCSKSFDGN